jgi:hypothetical protein
LETNSMTEQNLLTHDLLPAADSPAEKPVRPAAQVVRPAPRTSPVHKPKP